MSDVMGVQLPRLEVLPDVSPAHIDFGGGDDAVDLYEMLCDVEMLPWQRELTRWLCAKSGDGKPTVRTCGLSVPRQNGKTFSVLAASIYWAVVEGHRVLWTAHAVDTADEAWRQICLLFDPEQASSDAAVAEVTKISRGKGDKRVDFRSGGSWEISARSSGGRRGFGFSKIVLDEAFNSPSYVRAALAPTQSAAKSGHQQTVLMSSPPIPEADATWFQAVRTAALDKKSSRLMWWEFSAAPDDELGSTDTWLKANPSLGPIKHLSEVAKDYTEFSEDEFKREHLGMWPQDICERFAVPMDLFDAAGDPTSGVEDGTEVALGVDMSPAGDTVTISLAGWRADGAKHVEILEAQLGDPSWVAPWLQRFVQASGRAVTPLRAIVIDDKSPAKALVPEIEELTGFPITLTWATDMVSACGLFHLDIINGRLRHRSQPALSSAMRSVSKRKVGDAGGWAWNRKSATSDITPVVSTTLALHGLVSSRIKVSRERGSASAYIGKGLWG